MSEDPRVRPAIDRMTASLIKHGMKPEKAMEKATDAAKRVLRKKEIDGEKGQR